MILADTDALIDFLRGREPLAGRVRTEVAANQLVTTVISVFELMGGVQTDRDRATVDALLSRLPALRLERPASVFAGQIDQNLRQRGLRIATGEMLIAGIALQHGLSVLTKNVRHFARVPGLQLELL